MSTYDLVEELDKLSKAETEIFGRGQLLRVNSATDDGKGPQFASELSFLVAEIKNDDGSIRKVPIVVKKQMAADVRDIVDTNTQFANEVNMYNKIMPRLGVSVLNIIPRLLFGRATSGEEPDEDILILEDLRESGFKIPKDIYLNFDHISRALRKLGQFHGLSYNFKKSSPDDFEAFGRMLKVPNRKMDEADVIQFKQSLARGFIELLKKSPDDGLVSRTYEQLKKRDFLIEWDRIKRPQEPFSVIIHGDFNRNNLFYQYDSNEVVTDLKFLDFGTSLLADPSVDIAFFLYMNTDPETRNKHWDEFLDIYWSGLTSISPEPGFTFEEFLKNFRKRAISGYFPCSFFLPMMLSGDFGTLGDFFEKTMEERIEWANTVGGEEGTEAIVNILCHARDKGFMSAYLEDNE